MCTGALQLYVSMYTGLRRRPAKLPTRTASGGCVGQGGEVKDGFWEGAWGGVGRTRTASGGVHGAG